MKLLYITNGINGSGGLERVLSIKASAFADTLGYEVNIIVLNDCHRNPFYTFSKKIIFHSISVSKNPFKYFFKYATSIRTLRKKINPDVILVCDDGLKGFCVPKILQTKTPIVYERHASILINTDKSIKGRIVKALMRKLAIDFDKFIVLTDTNISEWSSKNIDVIPNPLSFYPTNSSDLKSKKAIVVGSQSHIKGYDLLILVWEKIYKKNPDWELHCYGKLDKNNQYENLAVKKKITTIFFHEATKSIQNEYLKSSFLIFPSRTEGFGMVLIEAMACGVPCVSFDCPSGPRDIIKNNEDGFLIPNGEINLMAEKVDFLINNYNLRKELGANAKQNSKRFIIENVLVKWENLFKNLLS